MSIGASAKDKTTEHTIEISVEFNEPCTQAEAEDIVREAIGDILFTRDYKEGEYE